MSTLKVDLGLVEKYNVAGPRYTSYPPATKFTDAITWPQLAEKIAANNQTNPRPFHLFSHSILRDALLVLRLHHRHHAQPRQRHGLRGFPWPRGGGDGAAVEPAAQSRATPLRRRLADFFEARRNPPARRNHPQTFHVFAGHRSQRGSGPAPAHARAHGRACARSVSTAPRWACRISTRKSRKPSTASSRAK